MGVFDENGRFSVNPAKGCHAKTPGRNAEGGSQNYAALRFGERLVASGILVPLCLCVRPVFGKSAFSFGGRSGHLQRKPEDRTPTVDN